MSPTRLSLADIEWEHFELRMVERLLDDPEVPYMVAVESVRTLTSWYRQDDLLLQEYVQTWQPHIFPGGLSPQ